MVAHRNISTAIRLTRSEELLRQTLVKVADELCSVGTNDDKKHEPLLGLESDDIDVAINRMTGYSFALEVQKYLERNPNVDANISHIAKVDSNPEQSKHLETATARLFDYHVDFVNLRSEAYSQHSRIPTVKFGTPIEDARRRDCTINALFYNLHTCSIEDFTGCGLKDLQCGLIRTPLPAIETFMDDPLRMLRLIRFSARFNFEMDGSSCEAMKEKRIQSMLEKKVSRERVGIEVEKMLSGPRPCKALNLIITYGLYYSIFTHSLEAGLRNSISPSDAFKIANSYEELLRAGNSFVHSSNPALRRSLWLLMYIVPCRDVYVAKKKGSRMIQNSLCEQVVRESLKFNNTDCNFVLHAFLSVDRIQDYLSQTTLIYEDRKSLGLLVRYLGKEWRLFILFAYLISSISNGINDYECKMKNYIDLINAVKHHGLETAFQLKPLVDGKMICQLLHKAPGPHIKKILQEEIEWQLDNPDKGFEECLSYLSQLKTDV